jgi:DNA (cytosine-5)-methyltransferase 1
MSIEEYHAGDISPVTWPADELTSCAPHPLRAIDLYSGVGGWGLGLRMAAISTVISYELADSACETQIRNLGAHVVKCDIRKPLPHFPSKIDIVVGSPPCTEFSFSNRGGGGNIQNGLKDLERFLSIVEEVDPTAWVFENVPRVGSILRAHLYGAGGKLKKFRHLFDDPDVHIRVFDMSRYGLPQRRIRCLVGKYPAALLDSYADRCKSMTLADVVNALEKEVVRDPIFGIELVRDQLTENEQEPVLTREETRLNRDAKLFHPIYNRMEFPDRLNRPVRAITATCTRVSRESVIVPSEKQRSRFRRLTLRERACLQGFPITYQFYAPSRSMKMELIGNAIPPLFAYYIGCAIRGVTCEQLLNPSEASINFPVSATPPPETKPTKVRSRYPTKRRFKATIPFLHFKSGVRFELSNEFQGEHARWTVRFFFGNSKDIRVIRPDGRHQRKLFGFLRRHCCDHLVREVKASVRSMRKVDARELQLRWAHRRDGLSPHAVVGALSRLARTLSKGLRSIDETELRELIAEVVAPQSDRQVNQRKFTDNCVPIVAGLICASSFNAGPSSGPSTYARMKE